MKNLISAMFGEDAKVYGYEYATSTYDTPGVEETIPATLRTGEDFNQASLLVTSHGALVACLEEPGWYLFHTPGTTHFIHAPSAVVILNGAAFPSSLS